MRINEYKSINEFKSQYIGKWDPSNGHWFGLDFVYKGKVYRLHTGTMYDSKENIDENGIIHQFGVYELINDKYVLLFEEESIEKLLKRDDIGGIIFEKIVMDDATELVGQD